VIQIEIPVLIVGAGPAGLTASALLADYGIPALAVSRHSGTANSPRAHITNQRAVEVFRDLGIEDRIVAAALPNHMMGNTTWLTAMNGTELVRIESWGSGVQRRTDYDSASPTSMCNLPQHIMEPIILAAAKERGARVRFDTELVSVRQADGAVYSTLLDRITGEKIEVKSQYLIGADGGNSVVAREIGFELEGTAGAAEQVSCWLDVDLSKYAEPRPSVIYLIAQPGNNFWIGSGCFICVKPWTEWVLVFAFLTSEGTPDLSEEAVIRHARQIIGDPDIPIQVKSVGQWAINHLFAKSMKIGRVMIAGDAAHRHPPANGLGTNTSIQDSYNLAWKLAMVLKGHADPSLLDSYSDERQPVAKQVVERANKSVANLQALSSAFGFRYGQEAAEGWASIAELHGNTKAGAERRKQLERAVEVQQHHFNAHGVELGQYYKSSAIVGDGTPRPQPTRDPELYYQPSTHPGSHLPHARLFQNSNTISSLDLGGRGRFTVITGHGGRAWLDAAQRLAQNCKLPIIGRAIGAGLDAEDVYGEWARLREIEDDGCLLVRPDNFVAYRSQTMAADTLGELSRALGEILGRKLSS